MVNESLRLRIRHQEQLSELVFLQALRILKGKRVVFVGRWNNQKVLAKIFTHKRHWLREIRGLNLLTEHSVKCPDKLFSGTAIEAFNLEQYDIDSSEKIHVLIIEYFERAINFRTHWRSELEQQQRVLLFTKLFRLIAIHHQAGIVQKDLHLGNFLILQDRLVSIDGDAIDYQPELTLEKCYEQLGILLVQSFPQFDDLLASLLPEYFKERKLVLRQSVWAKILKYRDKHRIIAKNSRINKSYRESTHFKVIQNLRQQICIAREFVSKEMENKLLQLAEDRLNQELTWTDENYGYIATRYTNHVASERRNWLKENQASICWQQAQTEIFFGEATQSPVALVLITFGPFQRVGYFVQTC